MSASAISELFDLTGRAALVTGAASGLGRAFAEILSAAGAHVVLADVDEAGMRRVADALGESGATIHRHRADVGDPDQVATMVQTAERLAGRLDIVFANAGISAGPGPIRPEGTVENIDLERWERVLRVNLTSVLTTIQRSAPALRRAGGGKIVVTSSIAGLSGNRLVGYAYAATKAAVANLVRQAAIDLARDDIQVNGIAPGVFATNIGGAGADPARQRPFALDAAAQRVAHPDEIKGLALLLASPASSYMTGAVIPIDGGTLAGVPIPQEAR